MEIIYQFPLVQPLSANGIKFGDHLYSFSTENIAGYLGKLITRNSEVLTVAGSGDHIINSIFFGSKKIIAFDSNPKALFWSEIKLVATRMLKYDEFLRFFLRFELNGESLNQEALSYDRFLVMEPFLSAPAREFFLKIYQQFDFLGATLRQSSVFKNEYDFNHLKIDANSYLQNDSSYNLAKNYLETSKITFLNCPLEFLYENLGQNTFDCILLSNISDYLDFIFPDIGDRLTQFVQNIVGRLLQRLRGGGILAAAYIYDFRCTFQSEENYRSQIDNPNTRFEAFKNLSKVEYLQFRGIIENSKDALLVCSK